MILLFIKQRFMWDTGNSQFLFCTSSCAHMHMCFVYRCSVMVYVSMYVVAVIKPLLGLYLLTVNIYVCMYVRYSPTTTSHYHACPRVVTRKERPCPTLCFCVSHGHVQHCHACPRVNSNVHGYTEELPWLRVLLGNT